MKKFLLGMILSGMALGGYSQTKETGDLQIGVGAGISVPLSTYKSLGNTKLGYQSGLFIDKYFNGNKFGLGVDARYIYHAVDAKDTLHFQNGHISINYLTKERFQNLLFTFGPTYKISMNKFHVEAYARGGMMMQQFPEYTTTLYYTGRVTPTSLEIEKSNNASNKANTWAGVGGLRFNYELSSNFALFGYADYVQGFGKKFGSKSSLFEVEYLDPIPGAAEITNATVMDDHVKYYGDVKSNASTPHKSFNAGLGIKYVLKSKVREVLSTPVPVKYDEVVVEKMAAKALQIMVKDKQTNLALSGVIVSVTGSNLQEKSTTNANGEASLINELKPGLYDIIGEKNGIKTTLVTVSEADFKSNSSVIFKEIFHDDPRFTLVGETYDCNLEKNLSSINTVLTNVDSKGNATQISDGEGKFIYQLEPKSEFTVMANQQGRYSQTELVTTKGLDRSKTLYVTLKLGVCDLVKDGTWVLKNILYDFDKHNIRTDAALVLDNVVNILQQNPSLRIELSSHTDSRGNDQYNMSLSQRRADAAVAYLVSKGISSSRLVSKGYGESRLLNDCGNGVNCSDAQHQENRRTEIKILEYAK